MKFTTQQMLLGALAPLAAAFPSAMFDKVVQNDPALMARANQFLAGRQSGAGAASAVFEPIPMFNAKNQYIDVSEGSGHEWQAPNSTDLRGPCPGLNAFANHGFLPHNGYATLTQLAEACESTVGMGIILANFLAVLGGVLDGDGVAWSIGGTPSVAQAGVLGNQGNGIANSHNKYESDASPTRPDLYEAGNDYITQADQFNQMIAASKSEGSITMDSLTEFRSARFDTQIANNPYFFNGPFTGVAVQPAAYTFIFRFMANHSEEYPVGLLNYDVVASWFGMTDNGDGTYTANQGHERIPDNWYRRPYEYPYETDYFTLDLINAALLHPKFVDVGGNTGTTNSFTGVNIDDLSGGVLNSSSLLEGNNLACFAFQAATQVKPDILLSALDTLTDALGAINKNLSCPQLKAIDESQLEMFPGYTKSDVASNTVLGGLVL